MTARPERCETCRYWESQGGPLASAIRNPAAHHDEGTCNIGPPTMLLINGFAEGVWPRTHRTRFCGEWEAQESGDGPNGGEEIQPAAEQIVVPIGAGAKPRAIEPMQTAARFHGRPA